MFFLYFLAFLQTLFQTSRFLLHQINRHRYQDHLLLLLLCKRILAIPRCDFHWQFHLSYMLLANHYMCHLPMKNYSKFCILQDQWCLQYMCILFLLLHLMGQMVCQVFLVLNYLITLTTGYHHYNTHHQDNKQG